MDPTDNLSATSSVKRKANTPTTTAASTSNDNSNNRKPLAQITPSTSNDRAAKRKRTDEVSNNWHGFTNEIRQIIDVQNQSARPISQVQAIMPIPTYSYQLDCCQRMLERMSKFVKDMEMDKHQNITDGYIIINNITKERFAYPWNLGITIGKLEEYFSVTGHAFAVDLKKTYTFQLAFDLDCIDCKKAKCQCASVISASVISSILNDIVDIISDYLQISTHDLMERQVIFKAMDSCNIHIYFDVSVSIILYNELIDMLTSNLSAPITDKYLIDKVTSLPLPYSAKSDGKTYTPLIREPDYQTIVVSSKQQFYEMPLYVTTLLDYSVYKVLGSFKQSSLDVTVNEWSDSNEISKHLSIKLKESCKLKIGIDHQIHSLKNTNIKFNASSNKNLDADNSSG